MSTATPESRAAFARRLGQAIKSGRPLGDTRNQTVLRTWVAIVAPLSEADALTLVPATLRHLWRDPAMRPAMSAAGLPDTPPTRYDTLGAAVASYIKHLAGLRDDTGKSVLGSVQGDLARLERRTRELETALAEISQTACALEEERERQEKRIRVLEGELVRVQEMLRAETREAANHLARLLAQGINDPNASALVEARARLRQMVGLMGQAGLADDVPELTRPAS
ncbi:hypothetical protein [Roseospirillum parvum]|uniref:Uncharacterized protein n=1 Tax=Roseospirillum parvum TaxID=83401 RepID=A0A1G7TYM5_9PROT|nr:hypothetical protein [Roseospirillum parvum]SDG39849.1 hypothetical protein SAMN05421742_101133 [Roseospirillum parvum]